MAENILKDFDVMEISLVKEGAVMEDFLLLKNKEGKMAKENLVDKIKKTAEVEDIKEEVKAEAVVETKEEPKVEPKLEEPKIEEPKIEEPKAEPAKDEVTEVVKALEAEKAQLVEKLKSFEDKEKEAIYKTKAEKLSNINTSDLFVILKEVDEKLSKEVAEKLNNLLSKVNTVVEKSKLFEELGNGSEDSVNDLSAIEKIAKSRSEKEKISYEKAYTEELFKRPELYKGRN